MDTVNTLQTLGNYSQWQKNQKTKNKNLISSTTDYKKIKRDGRETYRLKETRYIS